MFCYIFVHDERDQFPIERYQVVNSDTWKLKSKNLEMSWCQSFWFPWAAGAHHQPRIHSAAWCGNRDHVFEISTWNKKWIWLKAERFFRILGCDMPNHCFNMFRLHDSDCQAQDNCSCNCDPVPSTWLGWRSIKAGWVSACGLLVILCNTCEGQAEIFLSFAPLDHLVHHNNDRCQFQVGTFGFNSI